MMVERSKNYCKGVHMRFNYFWKLTLIAIMLASAAWPVIGNAQSQFAQGIASGEVTSNSTVLWTRANGPGALRVEVSKDSQFKTGTVQKDNIVASAENDFTVKALITNLTPDQTYFYRWRDGGVTSEIGTFRTAPSPEQRLDV